MESRLSDRILTMAYLLVLGTTFLVKLMEGEFSWMAYVLLAMTCTVGCYRVFSQGSLRLPASVYAGVVLFLVMFFFLGEIMMGFYKVTHWDKAIHLVSGIVLPFIGYRVYLKVREGEGSRFLAVSFALMFGIFIATAWALFEFSTASLIGPVSQSESLQDTMMDLVFGSMGSSLTAFGLYLHIYKYPIEVFTKIEEEAKRLPFRLGKKDEEGIGK
ncbi:MAG TPA: hypothetical protein VLN47_01820 [Clostridiaceae bacterium]|nr:hypothetical protein [Clostridiaceae bacterium]